MSIPADEDEPADAVQALIAQGYGIQMMAAAIDGMSRILTALRESSCFTDESDAVPRSLLCVAIKEWEKTHPIDAFPTWLRGMADQFGSAIESPGSVQ